MIALAIALLLHDESVSSSRLAIGRADVTVTFAIGREDLTAIGSDPFDYVRPRYRLWNNDAECDAELVSTAPLTLRYVSREPIGRLKLRCEILRDIVKKHTHVAETADGRSIVFEKELVEAEWSAAGGTFLDFVVLGIEHIVTGWDHIVFLLALLLVASPVGRVVRLVTAFTLAHSVTLGLTAMRVIGPPAAIVESVIAASIVYVAIENVVVKEARWRWALVFAFGLVHGMGFGGILVEMELARPATALIGFNLGVELGQLALVAAAYPLVQLLRRREEFYRRVTVRALSGAAAAVGVMWLLERALQA